MACSVRAAGRSSWTARVPLRWRAAGGRHAASGLRAAGLVSRVVTVRGVTAGARGGRGLLPELRASGEGRRTVLPELRGEHRWVRPPGGGEDTRVRTGIMSSLKDR